MPWTGFLYFNKAMSKEVWVKVVPWKKKLVTTSLEGGADAVVVKDQDVDRVKELGRIPVVSPGGDIKPERDFARFKISSPDDLDEIVKISRSKRVIVETKDWHVIPLENLVAQADNLMVTVRDRKEAELALNVLEIGVSGIVVDTDNIQELRGILKLAKSKVEQIDLKTAIVTSIRPVGMGDRVCVDTCSEIASGAGLLVGNSSSCMFLVHAENVENPYVTPRPFRVNAGAVHAYVLLPGGKTGYLWELSAGDRVLVVNHRGECSEAVVGRIKVERRPLLLVEAETNGGLYTHIVQNAETIRFVKKDGSPVSVVDMQEGDKILVYREKAGRHFGMKIEESIKEK